MDFGFSSVDEIAAQLGGRLRAVRLSQALQQSELAARAGVSVGTVKSLEKTGQSTLVSLIRVVQALGLVGELQPLFVRQVQSIADMERAVPRPRQRAPRKPRPARPKRPDGPAGA